VLSFHPRQQIGSCSPCVAGFLLAFPVVSHCCSPLSASRLLHALVSRFARCPVGAVLSSASISVYLAMPCGECRTDSLLRSLFEAGQSVYIPRVTGSGRTDMQMLRVESLAQLESFPRSRWGIPEPTAVEAAAMDDGTASGAATSVTVGVHNATRDKLFFNCLQAWHGTPLGYLRRSPLVWACKSSWSTPCQRQITTSCCRTCVCLMCCLAVSHVWRSHPEHHHDRAAGDNEP
jgi:hypothetical protein